MMKVKFKANLNKFSVKAPEEGGVAYVTNVLSMSSPDRKALAALCEIPDDAQAALDAAGKAAAKIEIPCGQHVCSLTVTAGSKKHEPTGVCFKKVVLDSRGGECQMRIVYQEPKTNDGCGFYLRNLGVDLDIACTPTQATIDDEIAGKRKGQAKDDDGDKAE